MRVFIGNDIVDLKNPDISGKHKDERFLKRVLSATEHEDFCKFEDKKETLWKIWSGKEASYKVLKKKFSKLVFSHSKFVVSIGNDKSSGVVTYEDHSLSLRWSETGDWIHCVAVEINDEKHLDVLEYDIKDLKDVSHSVENFNSKELASTYSPESAGVRNLTKTLLKKHMLEEVKIIRQPLVKKFSPPELYLSEIPLKNWDLSMSHDGRFVSCAVSRRGPLDS